MGPDLKRKGPIFLEAWEGRVISKVEIRGIIISSVRIGTGGYQVSIDDGSGRISAVIWNSDGGLPSVALETFHNKYVSMRGTLVGFRSEMQLRIEAIDLIATSDEHTEEQLWWLDVKEEWENFAAKSRSKIIGNSVGSDFCPCLCHSGSGETACRTIGTPSSWPPSFCKAVAVISSTLRSYGGEHSLCAIIELLKAHQKESPSLATVACFSDCAGVEAVRQLVNAKYISTRAHSGSLIIHTQPQQHATTDSPTECPRYPMTPAETLLTQIPNSQDNIGLVDLRIPKSRLGAGKFF